MLGGYQLVIKKFGASWFRRPKRIAIAGTPVDMRNPEATPKHGMETLRNLKQQRLTSKPRVLKQNLVP